MLPSRSKRRRRWRRRRRRRRRRKRRRRRLWQKHVMQFSAVKVNYS
jgi:hypothetical protein